MKKIIISLLVIFSFNIAGANPPERRIEKYIEIADAAYGDYAFEKAVKYYLKAYELSNDPALILPIASTYKMLNRPAAAVVWYEKAYDLIDLGEDALLDYSMVLAATGAYTDAKVILKRYVSKMNWVKEKVDGFENLEIFHLYENAFSIQPMSLNSNESDFAPTIYKDGISFVSSRSGSGLVNPRYNWDNSGYLDIYYTLDGSTVRAFSSKINTRYHEGPMVFYENETKLIFTRNELASKNERIPGDNINKLQLFYTELKPTGKWSKPKKLAFQNNSYSYGHPAITDDGMTLYFVCDKNDGEGTDLYASNWADGHWSEPVMLGQEINTPKNELFPFVKGDQLFFASDGHKGLGGLDVYVWNLNGLFEKPRNLGYPLNSDKDDFGFVLRDDHQNGYFASNRIEGQSDDIFEVEFRNYLFDIELFDSYQQRPVEGNIFVRNSQTEEAYANQGVASSQYPAVYGEQLQIVARVPGYEEQYRLLDTRSLKTDDYLQQITFNFSSAPEYNEAKAVIKTMIYQIWNNEALSQEIEINEDVFVREQSAAPAEAEMTKIQSMLFDFDSYEISTGTSIEINKLQALLMENSDLSVTLTGFTDPRGSEAYNLMLSEKRAFAIQNALISAGIAKERINIMALGEENLISNCQLECSEEAYQKDRRVEIKIILDR